MRLTIGRLIATLVSGVLVGSLAISGFYLVGDWDHRSAPFKIMHYTFGAAIGVICLVLAVLAVRAFFDAEHPRPKWAKLCLALPALSAFVAGSLTGMLDSGKAGLYTQPALTHAMATFYRGLTIGLFYVLAFSGGWSGKRPPL